jgi:hypothetical protein
MGWLSKVKKTVKKVPVVGGAVSGAINMAGDAVKGVGQATGLIKGEGEKAAENAVAREQEMLGDADQYQKGFLLDAGKYNTGQFSGTSGGMPKGQQEAMRHQMEAAKKAVASSFAGGQKGRSGAAMKALSDRQQGIAAQNYQQAFQNSLAEHQANQAANQQNFNQNYMGSQQAIDQSSNMLNARLQGNQNKQNQEGSKTNVFSRMVSAFNPFS